MNDLTALVVDPRVADHVADNSRANGKVFLQFAGWAGTIIGVVTFLSYIGSEWGRINANRDDRTHKQNWPSIVTSRPLCLSVGIPVTMVFLLLRPTYLKKGMLCANELTRHLKEAIKHPISASTQTSRENQVLSEMYPEIYKDQG